jgi:hypothetical protein
MSRSSSAQIRRRRLGLPDRAPVDPATSERNRRAAMARWSKSGKEYTRDQVDLGVDAKPDERVATRAAGQLHEERAAALFEIAGMLKDAVRVHRRILNDETVKPETRLQAAKLAYEIAGLGEIANMPPKDICELTREELDAFLLSATEELESRGRGLLEEPSKVS